MPDEPYDPEHPWRTPGATGPALNAPKPSASPSPKPSPSPAAKKSTAPDRGDYPSGVVGDTLYQMAIHRYGAEGIAHGDDKPDTGKEQRKAIGG